MFETMYVLAAIIVNLPLVAIGAVAIYLVVRRNLTAS